MAKLKPGLDSAGLRARLKLKNFAARNALVVAYPQAAKLLASGAVAGSLLLASPGSSISLAALPPASVSQPFAPAVDPRQSLVAQLKRILPSQIGPLTDNQETQISQLLHQLWGLHAAAHLEGDRLNRSYGLIGAEQHLSRYPGDNVPNMAPGRGAWGYFAPSAEELTADLVAKEKYYVAVQTLYLPDWQIRLAYLRDWYKYRKVVVINPVNGKTVVAVIADSGPAAATGKHFGGSPEIMAYLELNVGYQKGPVILFFLDDPADQVSLGPVEYNLEKPPLLIHG